MNLKGKVFRKIPIIITGVTCTKKGRMTNWTVEIADSYENYKPSKFEDINFEDLSHHFIFPVTTKSTDDYPYTFELKKDAVEAAEYVLFHKLQGKAKIWFNT